MDSTYSVGTIIICHPFNRYQIVVCVCVFVCVCVCVCVCVFLHVCMRVFGTLFHLSGMLGAPTSYNLRPPPNQTHVEDLDLVITLSCEADGATSPDARAEWTIFLANGEVRRENTTRLMVPVIRENNGLYMCQLINIVRAATYCVILNLPR